MTDIRGALAQRTPLGQARRQAMESVLWAQGAAQDAAGRARKAARRAGAVARRDPQRYGCAGLVALSAAFGLLSDALFVGTWASPVLWLGYVVAMGRAFRAMHQWNPPPPPPPKDEAKGKAKGN